jgi:hypothetical protein
MSCFSGLFSKTFTEGATLRKACGLDRLFAALCRKRLPEGCAFCTLLSVFRRAGMSIHRLDAILFTAFSQILFVHFQQTANLLDAVELIQIRI